MVSACHRPRRVSRRFPQEFTDEQAKQLGGFTNHELPSSRSSPARVFLRANGRPVNGARFITGQLLAVDGGLMMLGA
jgi:hypothetical protein